MLSTDVAMKVLEGGEIEVLGVLPYASNYTYLARISGSDQEALAVYKPRRGERPLWDFPIGTLARREVCAFLVSEAAGFRIVPPTVLRTDAPLGDGSLQLFVEHDPERHYFSLVEDRLEEFAAFAAFDVAINNADRKAGHVIEDVSGRLWGLDHGVSFHWEPKLRTVIWEFADRPLDDGLVACLEGLRDALRDRSGLCDEIARLLSPKEATATLARVERFLTDRAFPGPPTHHPFPWPLV
ncbi:MAG: SCO1664 family protein [Actinomycetota bacterium]